MNEKIQEIPLESLVDYFKMIVERYLVHTTGSKKDADDISQEVFLRIWPEWERLSDLTKRKLGDYVFITLKNYLVDQSAAAKKEKRCLKYMKESSSEFLWHDEVLLNEGFAIYEKATNQLPKKERMIYCLYQNGFNREQIAEIVERSENTVNNQIRSASQQVKRFLNRNFDLNLDIDGRGKLWKFSSN